MTKSEKELLLTILDDIKEAVRAKIYENLEVFQMDDPEEIAFKQKTAPLARAFFTVNLSKLPALKEVLDFFLIDVKAYPDNYRDSNDFWHDLVIEVENVAAHTQGPPVIIS